jgi:hypothetical protein
MKKVAFIRVFLFGFLPLLSLMTISDSLHAQIDEKRTFPTPDSLMRKVGEENVDTSYSFQWNKDSNQWEIHGRDLLFYNQKHKLFTRINQRWHNSVWMNVEREIKEYNDNGEVHQILHQSWNEAAGTWVNLELKTYLYNAQGEKSEILYQQWRKALGEWISTVRYLFEYNRDGDNISILIRTYSSSKDDWLNFQRYLFSYSSSYGPPNEAIVQNWDRTEKDWVNTGRYYMAYNFRGNKIRETRSTWIKSRKEWVNGVRFLFDYDRRLKKSKTEQHWNTQTNEWNNAVKYKYYYDEEGELKEEDKFRWNRDDKKWVLVRKVRYSAEKIKPELSK